MNHEQLLKDAAMKHSLKEVIRLSNILLDRTSEEINNKNSKEHSNFAAYVTVVVLDLKLKAIQGLKGNQ
jgi:hypothetical protein